MKGWIERWIILPLFIGCKSSESGVAIASTNCPKRRQPPSSPTRVKLIRFRKPSIGRGIHRLIRSVRNVSPVFRGYRDEEEETKMEIGFPTDVKHLTHIGIDGCITTINNSNSNSGGCGCGDNTKAPEITTLPAISHKQLEVAMAAQASSAKDSVQVDID